MGLVRSGVNPWKEARTVARLVKIYRRERPDIVHHVALKPILYGSLAAAFSGTRKVVNALTGLGWLFTGNRPAPIRHAAAMAYRAALKGSKVIFQNKDDLKLFVDRRIMDERDAVLIRGSGVNLDVYAPTKEPPGTPLVILPGRMLADKGVSEFVSAAWALKLRKANARFALVGETDPENPGAIKDEQLKRWQSEGVVECWGRRDDMPEIYSRSAIVCLPSYREGLPKALIEAAACGRPIVATDVPGCREIARHQDNALLVPAKDASALADALNTLLESPDLRARMGRRGREIAEAEFSQEIVAEATIALYKGMLDGSPA